MNKNNERLIGGQLEARGVHDFGFAELPRELRPFEGLGYAVSFMLPLPRAVVDSIRGGPTKLYFHHYRTMNACLDAAALQLEQALMAAGHDAAYIPASQSESEDGLAGLVSHKAVATLAGLGSIGRNALFLSARYGPSVRLSTVLTDMPLAQTEIRVSGHMCTGCNACVRACPTGALYGADYHPGLARAEMMDAQKCSAYMKRRYRHIGRGAVCGICMAVCPLNNITKV